VGDARALLFRRDWRGSWHLIWRTEDQTYAALGQTPPQRGDPNDPCRMVGTGAVGEPSLRQFRLRDDDLLLLCSDGLHQHVSEPAIAGMVSAGLRAGLDLEDVAGQLVSQAARNGSTDDISALLLRRTRARASVWLWLALIGAALAAWAAQAGTGIS
jgi:PPM family protein phosphatase